jgi:hypothetical protein
MAKTIEVSDELLTSSFVTGFHQTFLVKEVEEVHQRLMVS